MVVRDARAVSSANFLLDERDVQPLSRGAGTRVLRALAFAAAVLGTIVAVVGAVVAGTGWLYLLRHTSVLAVGPSFRGALPLQQLAGGSAQPLGRMAAAWI